MCMFCQKVDKKGRKQKVLGMKLPIVENVPTPWESILKLWAASQLPYNEKNKNKKCVPPFCFYY